MLPQPAAEFCDLRQTEAKGLGLFAKVDIAKGTVISREVNVKIEIGDHKFSPATLTNPDFQEYFRTHMAMGVEEAMSNLVAYYQNDTFQPAIFDRLSRSFSGEGLSNHAKLLLTNCLDVSLSPLVLIHSGPTTCTLNHSCIANATVRGYPVSNDPSMLLAEVVAVKAIEAGTEITVPYQVFSDPTAERRLQPLEIYGFECVCDICMDDTARARDSYANINRLLEVVDTPLEDERKQRTPWLFFKAACELVDEYKRLGIEDKRYAQLFENCARVAAYHSDAIRTHKFLRFADVHWRMLRPTEVTRQLAAESIPEKHPQWGHTTLGLSSMQDNDLFRDRASAQDVYNRVMMTGYEESYDRIKPKEEAIAEEEILARKAADELVAEVEMEKGKQAAATPAKKVKKKRTRKQKAKKGATSGEGEDEESVGPILAAPDVRLNVGEAGRRVGLDGRRWEGGNARSSELRLRRRPLWPRRRRRR